MAGFSFIDPVASFVAGVAEGEAVFSGVAKGEGVTVSSTSVCGETGGWYLLLSQTK